MPEDPIDRMKRFLDERNWRKDIAFFVIFFWSLLFLVLFTGLVKLLIELAWDITQPETSGDKGDFRFFLTQIAALAAVLSALVALPFTALRLKLTDQQTRHSEDVLFNDKLHNALDDLHARRQVTEWKKRDGYIHAWHDDIIRRNGAIDRLEALAVEASQTDREEMVPRIARMLCVYLKEMSQEFPAEEAPEDLGKIADWARSLTVKRSDMENAAQVLGRMHKKTGLSAKELAIDLSGVNLQAMVLNGLNFEDADLSGAALDGAKLIGAWLNRAWLNRARLNGAWLNGAWLNGAWLNEAWLNEAWLDEAWLIGAWLNEAWLIGAWLNGAWLNGAWLDGAWLDENTDLRAVQATATALRSVDLSKVPNLEDLVKTSFGDASVILPNPIKSLVADKWPDQELDFATYQAEWELFKEDPAAYVPPQHRSPSE